MLQKVIVPYQGVEVGSLNSCSCVGLLWLMFFLESTYGSDDA